MSFLKYPLSWKAISKTRSDVGFAAARVFLSVASPSEDNKQEKSRSISQKSAIIIRELLLVTVVDNFIIPKGFSLYKKLFNYLSNSRWYKQKRKVERIHYRIACIRIDAQHKATTEIVLIGIETLKITNMFKNKHLAKALSDSALGGFLAKLKSKAEVLGIPVVEAPHFFASSKTCSRCGHKKDKLSLSERQYHCDICGYSVDRDVNAAINLKHLAVGHTESLNACGV